MTQITDTEIKLIYIELVLVGIIGIFLFFYSSQPLQTISGPVSASANNNSIENAADDSNWGWINNLASPTMGFPVGLAELLIISSIVLIPLTIMNSIVVIRIIKDLATQWV